ncbi:MAG: hypothetical protein KIT84_08840 [Labilithrix sp.]|nr:hypothetical protein [Labilithrix sp.]MCW5811105.1 hypothetical protein [Labilithrix sp.]
MRSKLALVSVVGLVACHAGGGGKTAENAAFRGPFVGASQDPTLRGARLIPESVDETTTYGAEAGGGMRVITAGLRVVSSPNGALVAAEDRLQPAPSLTVNLPERLGGGFLFVLGTQIWRADRWLAAAKPIYNATQGIQAIIPGLDRVYVRSPSVTTAIDGRTGQVLDLGPWPASPYVASYAAADGWRAAAVTDMRGVVATFDAGATWRTLDLPIEAKQVVADRDSLAIGGFEASRTEAWYEVRPDGSIARLAGPPRDLKTKLTPTPATRYGTPSPAKTVAEPSPKPPEPRDAQADKEDFDVKTFGKRPLAAAIEDGWPLTDGSAVVARDGALARIRITDGALLEVVRDAFPLKPARCHPITLTRPKAIGAFGFVCGEPRGTTVLYAYEPLRGRLSELKRFDKPRVVTSSGNGAIAVRGPCAEDGEPTPPARPEPAKLERAKDEDKSKAKAPEKDDKKEEPKEDKKDDKPAPTTTPPPPQNEIHPYCVLGHDDTWREIHVRGDVGGERVVVLSDGRIVVVSPPQGIGAPARLTILDKGKATTAAVTFPKLTVEKARVLRLGLWLDGFEERRPNVVGGWIEAGGVLMGLEIALDGKAEPGQFLRDAGVPFVSGKYGLGWTQSRRGYETIDGGMTWTPIDLPDPLLPTSKVERRACGPIGCIAHGWLRVGWGEQKREAPPSAPPAVYGSSAVASPSLQLACEPLATAPPAVPAPRTTAAEGREPTPARVSHGRPVAYGSSGVLGGGFNGLQELPAFYNQPAVTLRDPDRGINPIEIRQMLDGAQSSAGPVAKLYGWGPRSGDWDTQGRWQVKWLSPFHGWPEVKASLPTLPPALIVDMTRLTGYSYGSYSYGGAQSQLAQGDDGSHMLLIAKRYMAGRIDPTLFELEADRAPVEVHRADGEPFGDVEGAVRVSGRWFISTPPGTATPYGTPQVSSQTIIWQVEGGVARELVRVPRASSEVMTFTTYGSSSRGARLARRSDGRAIGLVADGQPTPARTNVSTRWVLPIDLETGALGEPELLGYVDLAGRALDACTDDVVGWVLDAPMPSGSAVRVKLPRGSGLIQSAQLRMRLTSDRACVERVGGNYDGQSADRTAQLVRPGAPTRTMLPMKPGDIAVSAMSALMRYPLRCTVAK